MPRKAKEKIDENKIIDEEKIKINTTKTSSVKKDSVSRKRTTTKKINENSPSEDNKKIEKTKNTSTKSSKKDSTVSNKSTNTKKSSKASSTKSSTSGTTKNSTSRKNTSKTTSKSTSAKSTTTKASSAKKATAKTTSAKGTTTKAASAKKATTKTTSAKSTTTKTTSARKTTTRKRVSKKVTNQEDTPIQIVEYYDLPYKYGHTLVRLLAQSPKTLFVYWEVSDLDIENFKKLYGDNFFNITKPVIIVHNLTLNKSYEVEINDFANCWYLNTEDSDCRYNIELGRRFISPIPIPNIEEEVEHNINQTIQPKVEHTDYIYITTSNDLQSPNDHILFEKLNEFVIFKDVSNNTIIKKNIKSFKFLKDIYKFYQDMYDEEILKNPSSKFKF